MRKRVWLILLLACGLAALFIKTLLCAGALTGAYGGLSVRICDTPVPGAKLKRLLAAEANGAVACTAAWTRGQPCTIAAPAMQTAATLRPIAVYGDMRQIAPMTLLSGSFPAEDDYAGCLLDAESAQTLFRSVDVVGVRVEIGGEAYTVRGVVKGGEAMALLRRADASYENLELAPQKLSSGKADAEAFLYKYALSGDYALVQSGLYARVLSGLAPLPAVLFAAAACIGLLRAARRRGGRSALLLLLPAAACAAGAFLLLRATFYWPQAFLPTKCSDFAFWGKLIDRWQAAWRAMSLITPLPKDMQFFRAMRAALLQTAIVSLLCAWLSGLVFRPSRGVQAKRIGDKNGDLSA